MCIQVFWADLNYCLFTEIIEMLPFVNFLKWHWNIVFKKKSVAQFSRKLKIIAHFSRKLKIIAQFSRKFKWLSLC